jgi:lysophospholipase L1-like esterase
MSAVLICTALVGGLAYVYRHRVVQAAYVLAGKDSGQFKATMRFFHARQWQQASAGSTVLIGDSHIQSLYIASGHLINLGTGGDTVVDLTARLSDYRNLHKSSQIILCIGANDALRGRSDGQFQRDTAKLFEALPAAVPLRLAAIPPVGLKIDDFETISARILRFNDILKVNCKAPRCIFLRFPDTLETENGSLSLQSDSGDHLHLSAAANKIWMEMMMASNLQRISH